MMQSIDPVKRYGLMMVLTGLVALVGISVAWAESDKPTAQKKIQGFTWEGEEIFFSVEANGAEAARASIRAGARKKKRGLSYVPLSAKVITHGFFAKSFPVNHNGDTFIDPKTLLPLKADKYIREKGEDRVYKVRFNPGKLVAKVFKKVGKKERNFDRPVPGETYDALSWLYALRAMPLKNGDKYVFYVFDGWKLSRLYIKVIGREKTWTPIQYYQTVKVDIEREILNSRWDGKGKERTTKLSTRLKPYYLATLHLTDDERRVPVRLFITSKTGDADFRIIKYTPPK